MSNLLSLTVYTTLLKKWCDSLRASGGRWRSTLHNQRYNRALYIQYKYMENQKEKHITLRCSSTLWEKFKHKASERGASASSAVRQFMQSYIQAEVEQNHREEPTDENQSERQNDIIETFEKLPSLVEPITWNVGDYFEDVNGRKGLIKAVDGELVKCIIYDRTITAETLPLSELASKVAV